MGWEADSKEIEVGFDEKHSVMKREPEPATPQNDSANIYPWSELDVYPGCLREHKMPPSHDRQRSVYERRNDRCCLPHLHKDGQSQHRIASHRISGCINGGCAGLNSSEENE